MFVSALKYKYLCMFVSAYACSTANFKLLLLHYTKDDVDQKQQVETIWICTINIINTVNKLESMN